MLDEEEGEGNILGGATVECACDCPFNRAYMREEDGKKASQLLRQVTTHHTFLAGHGLGF